MNIQSMTLDELRVHLIEEHISMIWEIEEAFGCKSLLQSLRELRDRGQWHDSENDIIDFCIELAFYRCQIEQIKGATKAFVGEL